MKAVRFPYPDSSDDVIPISKKEHADLSALPFDKEEYREDVGAPGSLWAKKVTQFWKIFGPDLHWMSVVSGADFKAKEQKLSFRQRHTLK